MTFSGKVAIVTGGGSGIGRASAMELARNGFAVAVAGRRDAALQKTIQQAGTAGERMMAVPTDVTSAAEVDALFQKTQDAFGRLDVLFNNAGTNVPPLPLEDLTEDQWRLVVDVNLTGALRHNAGGG